MRQMVATLAGDVFAGRRVGSPGGRAAAVWLAGHLRAAGVTVALDEFAVSGTVREVYATPQLVFTGERARSLTFRRDFCEHLASADAPQPRSGRLGAAGDFDPAGAWILEDAWSGERAAAAARAGAAGMLIPRGTDAAGWMPKMIAGPATVDIPVLAVRSDIHQQMRTAVGRATVTASVPMRMVDVTGSNVIGTFRRPAPGQANVVLTAHYDGVGDDPGARFPAACDNASGVAAVVEAARVLDQLLPAGVGLAVALLDGEEAGAHGSAHHARSVEAGTYVINLDGAAQLDGAAHVEAGGPARPLLAALDAAGRQVGVPLKAAPMPSDNRRYAAAGLASVGIGMGMPGYQTPAETPDRVEPQTLDRAARLVIATVTHLIASRDGAQAAAGA
ncbi:M28 family peptidase [Hamadaea sp. NPDC050747]|uniref:M28 family peptidase n=1 Tax=Hamadaea sp. NPDC050747 TaxID=3155789 RepID=UPI0033C49AA7